VRAILDTNVLLSGLLWRGAPHALIALARNDDLALVSSPALLAELTRVLGRAKFDAILARIQITPDQILTEIRHLADIVDPPALPTPICRDADDDAVLALAVAARIDLIVSGDDDLLALQSYVGIPIAAPAQALRQIHGLPSGAD
jgi:putative PIN family toxin of toxin-antitoxin system